MLDFNQIQKGSMLKGTRIEEANGPENVHCVSVCCVLRVVVVSIGLQQTNIIAENLSPSWRM